MVLLLEPNLISELRDDSAIQKWLSYYDVRSYSVKIGFFHDFFKYVRSQLGFEGASPSDLVAMQRDALKNGDEYRILDVLQQYILQKEGTHKTLRVRYNTIHKFFSRNRASLPQDDFRVKATRSSVRERLTVDVIKMLIDNSGLEMKAFYLSLFQGILDQERFLMFNQEYGGKLTRHLKDHGIETPFLVEFEGRKQSKNRIRFHTFLGRDALEAWKTYFELVRGYPSDGEVILLDRWGKCMSKHALLMKHLRLLEKLKYIKRSSERSIRYGYHLHEFRDVVRTLLHLEGRKEDLDMDAVEFWMGHIPDPNNYNKFYRNTEYMLEQYRIAEKYLNIMSGGETQRGGVDSMISNKDELLKLAKALEDYGFILAKKTA